MKELDTEGQMAVPMDKLVTPKFTEDTNIMTGVLDGVPVIGTHSEEETFIIPCSLLLAMMEVYLEVYTPGDTEGYQ